MEVNKMSILSKKDWREKRLLDLNNAILEALKIEWCMPESWIIERNEIIKYLSECSDGNEA